MLRPNPARVLPDYLGWYLNLPSTQDKLKDSARGSQIPFVSKGDLAEFQVPAPPIETQHKIVAVEHLRRKERDLAEQLQKLQQQYLYAVALKFSAPRK